MIEKTTPNNLWTPPETKVSEKQIIAKIIKTLQTKQQTPYEPMSSKNNHLIDIFKSH